MKEPVFISVRPGGRTVRYTKVGRRWVPTRENPIEVDAKITGTDLLLIAGGVAALGVVGYFLWVTMQDAAAAEGDGTAVGGNENVGANSSQGQFVNVSQPLGSAANTVGLYESQLPVTPSGYPLNPLPLIGKGPPPPLPGGLSPL